LNLKDFGPGLALHVTQHTYQEMSMNGVVGVDGDHRVIRHKVEKTIPPLDPDAYTSAAAAAAGGNHNCAENRAESAPNQGDSGDSERIEEAFARLKVVMQTQENGVSDGLSATKSHGQKTASEQFMDYMHLTPREKIKAGMLAELGITQEEYDAMSPEEKNKVNKKIEELEKIEAQHKIAEAESPQPMMKALAGEATKEHDSHEREFDIRSPDTDEPDSPLV
jgi:hypothetical protein